jgi:hypothetical protein
MINDQQQSSLATGTQIGAGFVSWGDFAIGYMSVEPEPVYSKPVSKFNVWKDMAEEPWKYGDDIENWLDLNAELQQAPGRWRLEAFWDAEEKRIAYDRLIGMIRRAFDNYYIRRDEAATRIQALWRGHMARNRIPWRDCCMCLAHHVSPIKTNVGYMCKACSRDGPYCDLIGMDDPWDWFRSEK